MNFWRFFNARVSRIARKEMKPSVSATHKELSEAMQKILENAPKEERKREILEAIGELYKQLAACD